MPRALRFLFVLVVLPASSVCAAEPVINELVVRPGAGEGEWVEILNPGPEPLRLSGWMLRDATGKSRLIPEIPELAPAGILVLAARPDSLRDFYGLDPDSVLVVRPHGWPILNDRDPARGVPADVVVLVDAAGSVVDSVAYFESWLPKKPGQSLERVDPFLSGLEPGAWGWCVDPAGGTPGSVNSLSQSTGETLSGFWEGPDSVEPGKQAAVFRYRLPGPGTAAIWLLDLDGHELAQLQSPQPVSSAGQWVWSAGSALPPRAGDY